MNNPHGDLWSRFCTCNPDPHGNSETGFSIGSHWRPTMLSLPHFPLSCGISWNQLLNKLIVFPITSISGENPTQEISSVKNLCLGVKV